MDNKNPSVNGTKGAEYSMRYGVLDTEDFVIIGCYIVIFVVAAVGNSTMFLVLLNNVFKRKGHSRMHNLLLHMNIADCLVTFIHIPKEAINCFTIFWLAPSWSCNLLKFLDVFAIYVSGNVLVAMSIDRYLAVTNPLSRFTANRKIKKMLAIAWASAAIMSLPNMMLHTKVNHPVVKEWAACYTINLALGDKYYNGSYFGLSEEIVLHLIKANTILNLLAIYIIPIGAIAFCYSSIIGHLRGVKSNEADRASVSQPNMNSTVFVKDSTAVGNGNQKCAARYNNTVHQFPSMRTNQRLNSIIGKSNKFGKTDEAMALVQVPVCVVVTEAGPEEKVHNSTCVANAVTSQKTEEKSLLSPHLDSERSHRRMSETQQRFLNLSDVVVDIRNVNLTDRRHSAMSTLCQPQLTLRRSDAGGRQQKKAIDRTKRMSVVMIGAFLVCWTPYFVSVILFLVDIKMSSFGNGLLYCFAVFNSSINPYLYGFFCFNIKNELRQLCGKPPLGHSSTIRRSSQANSSISRPGSKPTLVAMANNSDRRGSASASCLKSTNVTRRSAAIRSRGTPIRNSTNNIHLDVSVGGGCMDDSGGFVQIVHDVRL